MRNTILGQSHLKLGDTYYYPLESTVHISHIAQHAVAGERHAFRVSSLQLEVSSYLPVISTCRGRTESVPHEEPRSVEIPIVPMLSFRAQRSGVEKSFYAEALRREKKSHTDYTDFHRNSSPTTDYARKRADYTEPDEEKTGTTAIQICGIARFSEHKMWKENQRKSAESARDN